MRCIKLGRRFFALNSLIHRALGQQAPKQADSSVGCKHPHRSLKDDGREGGSVLLLIVGLCLVLLLVATVVVAVSAIYLERHKLQSLADQTASSTAQRVEGLAGSATSDAQLVLTPATVTANSQTFLAETGASSDFEGLTLNPATGVAENNTAEVVLSAVARPPIVSLVLPDGITITATGKARVNAAQ
ncbi:MULTISPECIES: pilus assembly protein TadG-related protein [Rothia]|uniref:pilus assembly protein TadG-related protein n=1 Tax=Rothia TaxID=32207 RepID=UPI0009F31C43|nr:MULTISPECIES: pilus assembly protein TadG-related protein [Rothia]